MLAILKVDVTLALLLYLFLTIVLKLFLELTEVLGKSPVLVGLILVFLL